MSEAGVNIIFWFKCDLGQKFYTPLVRPDWGLTGVWQYFSCRPYSNQLAISGFPQDDRYFSSDCAVSLILDVLFFSENTFHKTKNSLNIYVHIHTQKLNYGISTLSLDV